MTALIARLAEKIANVQANERLTEQMHAAQMHAAAAGRRSLVSLPKAGSPHRSPRLAPATSAEPSRVFFSRRRRHTRFATTCDGRPRPRFRGLSHQIAFF